MRSRLATVLAFVIPLQAAPLSGTKSVGPTREYASLAAAIANVNAGGNGLGTALVLELQSRYVITVETFPLTIPAFKGARATNTRSIHPASGATRLSIASADNTTTTVDLNGAQFVTVGGRPGGIIATVGQLMTVREGTDVRALFVRWNDSATAGVPYAPQFSADLSTWQDSTATPTVLADDGTNQIVSVPYPQAEARAASSMRA